MIKRKALCVEGFKNFLAVDRAVLFCLLSIVCLFISLTADLLIYPDNSSVTVFGDKRITVYQDKLPLTLEDLSVPADGIFRSSRLTERKSFLMRTLYGLDQSFSDATTVKDFSQISYTLYQSSWQTGLDNVASQQGLSRYSIDDRLAEKWNSPRVYSDGIHRMIVFYPRAVLVFSTSSDIYAVDCDIVMSGLDPDGSIFHNR